MQKSQNLQVSVYYLMQTNQRTDYSKIAAHVITKIQHFIMHSASSSQSPRPGRSIININEILIVLQGFMLIAAKQNNVLALEAPIKVVGDLQGHLPQLLRILHYGGQPSKEKYIFLGNYIEAGKYSLFTILYLYCLKIRFPKNVYLLRGNNQSMEMARYADFQKECIRLADRQVLQGFCESFTALPLAAVISDKIFCVHGGLCPEASQLSEINAVFRYNNEVSDKSVLRDLLWSDPMQTISGWSYNDSRNISYYFGPDVVTTFLQKNGLELMIRSHEFKENGYEINSLSNLITIFSAANYLDTYQNSGAFISISALLECSIFLLKPLLNAQKISING